MYEELSAWTNMSLHAELYGVGGPDRNKRIVEMLNLVQLYDRLVFSGGMKRRLALARALIHDPELLYLDEPIGSRCTEPSGYLGLYSRS